MSATMQGGKVWRHLLNAIALRVEIRSSVRRFHQPAVRDDGRDSFGRADVRNWIVIKEYEIRYRSPLNAATSVETRSISGIDGCRRKRIHRRQACSYEFAELVVEHGPRRQ